jgi:hypothetical protein
MTFLYDTRGQNHPKASETAQTDDIRHPSLLLLADVCKPAIMNGKLSESSGARENLSGIIGKQVQGLHELVTVNAKNMP